MPILPMAHLLPVALIVAGLLFAHWQMRNRTLESVIARTPAATIAMAWAVMAFSIVIAQGDGNAFIYFQF
jgi:alginate O-acetyltransferase complex protein AlgI